MATPRWDTLWTNARIATMRDGRYHALERGAVAAHGGAIAWVGEGAALPGEPHALARDVRDLGGAWITPGLIDCHTHLVYAGDRAREFELRLRGATYEEIARAGGGIVSTAAARRLAAAGPVTVRTTFLGAHTVPPEFKGRADDYVAYVCDEMLPAVASARLADAVDAFCESIAFSPAQTARVFERATALGLPVKLHADQLSDLGGAALAARFRALSADHLEYTSETGVRAMAEAGTVAVLLPGAFYFLRETRVPPVQLLRDHAVPIAVSTDCNPGSSPMTSILLALNMACTLFRLTPEEALAGATCHAARALGMRDTHGTIEVGKRCDLAVWDIDDPAALAYALGANPCVEVVKDGAPRRRDRAVLL